MVIFELMYCIPTMCQSFRILHLGTKINGYCKYLLVLDVHIREKLVVSNLYHSIKTTQFTFLSSSTAKESASLFIIRKSNFPFKPRFLIPGPTIGMTLL